MAESNEPSFVAVPTEDPSIRAGLQGPQTQPSLQRMCLELSGEPKAAELLNPPQEEVVLGAPFSGQMPKIREAFRAQCDKDHLPAS